MKWIKTALIFVIILFSSKSIAQGCTVSVVPVNFGSYETLSSAPNYSTGEVSVLCTSDLPFLIMTNPGSHSGGSFQPRKMYSTGSGDTLNYNLYRNSTHNEIWGDGTGSTYTNAGIGTNIIQQFTVYGRLPGMQNVQGGSYADQVTVILPFHHYTTFYNQTNFLAEGFFAMKSFR